jgi:hypothetical protein
MMSTTLLAVALDRVRIGWTLDRAFDEFLEAFFFAVERPLRWGRSGQPH